MDPSNPNTIYVLDTRALHKSTDGGATFADVTSFAYPRMLAVDSTGAVYVDGPGGPISVSTDGTASFKAVGGLAALAGPTLSVSGNKLYAGSYSSPIPFVIKLDPTGQNILYSTFLGGSSGDSVNGLAIDAQGSAVLGGTANSPDFPLTVPALSLPAPGKTDGFLAKLSPDGTHLIYSLAEAASKSVTIQAVALDSSGAA